MLHAQLMEFPTVLMAPVFVEPHYAPSVFQLRSAEHVHDFVHPVYTDRRGDARTIVTGLRCACGAVQALDYLVTAT